MVRIDGGGATMTIRAEIGTRIAEMVFTELRSQIALFGLSSVKCI